MPSVAGSQGRHLPATEAPSLVERAFDQGVRLPSVPWLNLPPDVVHFVTYLSTHERQHRGQIALLARQLGHRLPDAVTNGLWQWTRRAKERHGR